VEFEKRGGGEGGDVLMHARKGYKTLTFDICQKWGHSIAHSGIQPTAPAKCLLMIRRSKTAKG
jgi:hypothetical protein